MILIGIEYTTIKTSRLLTYPKKMNYFLVLNNILKSEDNQKCFPKITVDISKNFIIGFKTCIFIQFVCPYNNTMFFII